VKPKRPIAKVILVDDHPVVRKGIAGLLEDESFEVVGMAGNVTDAMELLARTPTDLVVVDLTLEQGSGLDVLNGIRRTVPTPAVVVYSVHEDGERVRRAIENGAKGYVTKREDPAVLVECLRHVHAGERFLSPRAARAMADTVAQGIAPVPEEVLSPQELQVYALAGRGLSAHETANQMELSVRTIETYYGRILFKLKLTGRREMHQHAIEWARRNDGA